MLETIDLSQRITKSDYKSRISDLEIQLGQLQRRARELDIPIVVVFEGWEAAGKGTQINRLIQSLDPRGYEVHATRPPTTEERRRPFLWRFWSRIPPRGRMAIFARSWYRRVLLERVDKLVKKKVWNAAYEQINFFERQLLSDGYVIVKFFLHISKKEQGKRLKSLESRASSAARVPPSDWRHHKQYSKYTKAVEEMLARTDTAVAPWTLVEAHDRRFATIKIYQTVANAIQRQIRKVEAAQRRGKRAKETEPETEERIASSVLDTIDLSLSLERDAYDKALDKYQGKIRDLQWQVYGNELPVVILYEGWDAAGKGGNIRRLVQALDPRGYRVVPIGAPSDHERRYPYLWRFWQSIPAAGRITIFDRSWYGRVLVERVEGLAQENEWRRAYREINEFEEKLVNFGTVLVKFWLHIDADEQLRRFEERERLEHKRWKITDEDWRNREKWELYRAAVDEMLQRTSTSYAPWTIVPANSKLHARIAALKTVERALRGRHAG